jgi:hypothetical protein
MAGRLSLKNSNSRRAHNIKAPAQRDRWEGNKLLIAQTTSPYSKPLLDSAIGFAL